MARRFVVGLFKGALVSAALALIWMKALGPEPFAGFFGYLAALATGTLVGLFAGKPPWVKGALIEAGLKSVVGAIVGVAALYGMRKWLHTSLDLGPLGAGAIGRVPSFALPPIGVILGILFEIDNTGTEPVIDARARVSGHKAPEAEPELTELEESDQDRSMARMRGKS